MWKLMHRFPNEVAKSFHVIHKGFHNIYIYSLRVLQKIQTCKQIHNIDLYINAIFFARASQRIRCYPDIWLLYLGTPDKQ
jgi:hypothetical protein